jgi:hypothetical protein
MPLLHAAAWPQSYSLVVVGGLGGIHGLLEVDDVPQPASHGAIGAPPACQNGGRLKKQAQDLCTAQHAQHSL